LNEVEFASIVQLVGSKGLFNGGNYFFSPPTQPVPPGSIPPRIACEFPLPHLAYLGGSGFAHAGLA